MADLQSSSLIEALQELEAPAEKMLALGRTILDGSRDVDRWDAIFVQLDERSAVYCQIEQFDLAHPGLLTQLLETDDGQVRAATEKMRNKLLAIVQQNAELEQRLRPMREDMFRRVQAAQRQVELNVAYRLPRWGEQRGALIDSRE